MKVLILGSTGYLGSAITDRLLHSGHDVVPLARESDAAQIRPELVPSVRVGDLAVPETLASAVTPDIDAVVHAAAPLGDWRLERQAVEGMLEALGERRKVFLYLSGAWVLGPSPDRDAGFAGFHERSPVRPIPLVAGREQVESLVTTSPVTGVVLRPGIAHGRGGGIPALLTHWAREHGRGRFVGSHTRSTWPVVHVDDLARLVEIALERAEPGDILHGVAESAVPVLDIAQAADLAAGGEGVAEPWAEADAARALGPEFAGALATSQQVHAKAATDLGWAPREVDIIADLVSGSYAVKRG